MSFGGGVTGRPRLRVVTCGAVDDGKSTLVGRLLLDCGAVSEDHIAEALRAGGSALLDPSLLVDGLAAERALGATIAVAYRYFSTARRAFMIADAPGHEQYTMHQAAAASQADLAVVVVSAVDGIREQTRRHMIVTRMFGVRDVVLAVSKMDVPRWDKAVFQRVFDETSELAMRLNQRIVHAIPLSARDGGNVVRRASAAWYRGPTLIGALEDHLFEPGGSAELVFLVQGVERAVDGARPVLGSIASGSVSREAIVGLSDGRLARVSGLWSAGRAVDVAGAGEAVALTLVPECDVRRGMMISAPTLEARRARQLEVKLVWVDEVALSVGRGFDLLVGTARASATVRQILGAIDLTTQELVPTSGVVPANTVVICRLDVGGAMVVHPFDEHRSTGGCILIDRATGRTVAGGVILCVVETETGDYRLARSISPADRARALGQRAWVMWLTGLPGAGKTTIATLLEQRLSGQGRHCAVLDGDVLRGGLTGDLGFSDADRSRNALRVAHVGALMADAGLVVIVALISPFAADRRTARTIIGADRFVEVFVDAPVAVCVQRDPKGLYRRATSGGVSNVTGLDGRYEPPGRPDVHVRTAECSVEQAVDLVMAWFLEAEAGRAIEGTPAPPGPAHPDRP